MLTDTHCHLDFRIFDEDRGQVMARAEEYGVRRMLNPGINLESSRAAVQLAARCQPVYAAVGIHPNEYVQLGPETLRELRALAAEPAVVAIGEIGLDYYRHTTPPGEQQRRFRAQLDLAAELELPVIIHCRDAYADALGIISAWQASGGAKVNAGVFHSFSGAAMHAETARELGFYLGITGPVTYPKAYGLRNIVAQAPEERLLIETDAPFLAPQPRRGKRNEPAHVRWVAEQIARVRGATTAVIARASTENADRLFGWDD